MDNATDNAEELEDDLQLDYNRASAITTIEIACFYILNSYLDPISYNFGELAEWSNAAGLKTVEAF